jgi:folate-binding protein YgfZ
VLEHTPGQVGPTLVRVQGAESRDLLHRISTQRLTDLGPGRCRPTLFCDHRGRLVHRVIVAVTSDEATWLVRDDAPPGPLVEFLERQIFRERITIDDRSRGAVVTVTASALAPVETLIEANGAPAELTPDERSRYVLGGPTTAEDSNEGLDRERARILAGRPRHGHEIDEAFNPYEVGLAHEVHLDKGCFTGQEALLRMMTYGGVRRGLFGVSGEGSAPSVPATVLRGGDKAGVVTSAVADAGGWMGLAVMRFDVAEARGLVTSDGVTIERCVAFPATRPIGLPEPRT